MPAPAAISPSAIEAAPMRVTVGARNSGIEKPSRLATSPDAVAMMSGLRTISPMKPRCACRVIGHTAPTLNSGTHTPISTAISCRPCAPSSRSASARPMKELKRKATCALAAWSRRSIQRPSSGTWGSAYASAMPVMPSARPAPIRPEAACRSSGVRTMDWNSSTGNRK